MADTKDIFKRSFDVDDKRSIEELFSDWGVVLESSAKFFDLDDETYNKIKSDPDTKAALNYDSITDGHLMNLKDHSDPHKRMAAALYSHKHLNIYKGTPADRKKVYKQHIEDLTKDSDSKVSELARKLKARGEPKPSNETVEPQTIRQMMIEVKMNDFGRRMGDPTTWSDPHAPWNQKEHDPQPGKDEFDAITDYSDNKDHIYHKAGSGQLSHDEYNKLKSSKNHTDNYAALAHAAHVMGYDNEHPHYKALRKDVMTHFLNHENSSISAAAEKEKKWDDEFHAKHPEQKPVDESSEETGDFNQELQGQPVKFDPKMMKTPQTSWGKQPKVVRKLPDETWADSQATTSNKSVYDKPAFQRKDKGVAEARSKQESELQSKINSYSKGLPEYDPKKGHDANEYWRAKGEPTFHHNGGIYTFVRRPKDGKEAYYRHDHDIFYKDLEGNVVEGKFEKALIGGALAARLAVGAAQPENQQAYKDFQHRNDPGYNNPNYKPDSAEKIADRKLRGTRIARGKETKDDFHQDGPHKGGYKDYSMDADDLKDQRERHIKAGDKHWMPQEDPWKGLRRDASKNESIEQKMSNAFDDALKQFASELID